MSYDEKLERELDAIRWDETVKALPIGVVNTNHKKDEVEKDEENKGD